MPGFYYVPRTYQPEGVGFHILNYKPVHFVYPEAQRIAPEEIGVSKKTKQTAPAARYFFR